MRSCVKINLTNENLIIKLNEEAEYKEIVESLKKKITQLKKLYKDSKMPILVIGKNLKEQERVEIKNIIQEKIDVKISFDMPQELGLHGIKKSFSQEIESSQTKFHRGAVRSGQKIEAKGSVVIIGDVNAGAEVIAGDNIIIQGNLRGLAHAGAKGNKDAIITAGNLEALQVRISNIVKEIDKTDNFNVARAYICVKNDKIEIEKW